MSVMTYAEAITKAGVTVPPHLEADAEVPVLTGMQRQGDLLIRPVTTVPEHKEQTFREIEGKVYTESPEMFRRQAVTTEGIQVVRGEQTGNTHWLHNGFDSQVTWVAGGWWVSASGSQSILGWVIVPEGMTAMLVHTDEHGANGIGPGMYAILQKSEAHTRGGWVTVSD